MERRLKELRAEATRAIQEGITIIVLSDRGVNSDNLAIPSLLAVSNVHHHMVREETRTRCGIVIETASGDEGERGLFLARDSSTIGLGEVLESVRGGGPGMMPSDARVAAMLERLQQGERETLGGFTVRDLIERTASAATAAPARGAAPERAAGQA